MSNAVFPTLPGLSWSVLKTPAWKTKSQQAVSGKEIRTAYYSRPIWNFTLSYEVLRGGNGYAEFQQLAAFFNLRQGSFDSFLFQDSSDYQVTDQAFGTGDGATKTFPLLHSIGGFVEPIGYASTPSIKVAGATTASFTSDGVNITFTTAPAAGAALTWSGQFYYRVRFKQDSMEFEQFMQDFWLLKKCELVGVI